VKPIDKKLTNGRCQPTRNVSARPPGVALEIETAYVLIDRAPTRLDPTSSLSGSAGTAY